MKKFFLAAIGCMMMVLVEAKEVTYNIYYNVITQTRGELYQYAQRYLGTTDVIMQDTTYYELNKVKGVQPEANSHSTSSATSLSTASDIPSVKPQLPLSEETLLSTNLAKKAESVAKQIYTLRETRISILCGDVEHMPADGASMQLVLDELDKQEKALTSMFVGTTEVQERRGSVTVNISNQEKAIKKTLAKFSGEKGLLNADAQEGEALTLSVIRTTTMVLAQKQPKKGEPIYEEKIVSSKTTIQYKNQTIYAQATNL